MKYSSLQIENMIDKVKEKTRQIAEHYGFVFLGKGGKNERVVCKYHQSESNKRGDNASFDGKAVLCFHSACAFANAYPKGADGIALIAFGESLDESKDFIEILERGYAILGLPLPEPKGEELTDEEKKRIAFEKRKQGCLNDFARACIENLRNGTNSKAVNYLVTERGLAPQTFFNSLYGCTSDDSYWTSKVLGKKYKKEFLIQIGLVNQQGYDFFRSRIMYFEIKEDRYELSDFTEATKFTVIGMQGRSYLDIDKKFRFLFLKKEILPNNSLYLWGTLKRKSVVVITEGVFDADSFNQCYGEIIATASFGTHGLSQELADDLARNPSIKTIYLCQDSDKDSFAGQMSNLAKARYLSAKALDKTIRIICLPSGKDPNNLLVDGWCKDEFQKAIDEALTLEEFEVVMHCQNALKKAKSGNIRSAQFDALRNLNDLLGALDNKSMQFQKIIELVSELLEVPYASVMATYNITSNKDSIDAIQTACHNYYFKNGKMPFLGDNPTKENPAEIDLFKLIPNYLKAVPFNSHLYKVPNYNIGTTSWKVPQKKIVRYCMDVRANIVTEPYEPKQ